MCLTRIGGPFACRCAPVLYSHHRQSRSSCPPRVETALARRATDRRRSRQLRRVCREHRG
eukprot:scaffold41598_cov32-Phaeocystis_antarctica.AAC.1